MDLFLERIVISITENAIDITKFLLHTQNICITAIFKIVYICCYVIYCNW